MKKIGCLRRSEDQSNAEWELIKLDQLIKFQGEYEKDVIHFKEEEGKIYFYIEKNEDRGLRN